MRIRSYDVSGVAANAAGIAAAAAPAAGVAMTLTATPVLLSPPREVELFSTLGVSAVVFTVRGTDRWDNIISQAIVGPGAGLTVRTRKVFATVTAITPDATSANTVSVGWGVRVPSPWVISNTVRGADSAPQTEVATEIIAGAADGQLEGTYENVMQISGEGAFIDEVLAVAPPDTNPVIAAFVRLVNTSGAGTTLRGRFLRPSF